MKNLIFVALILTSSLLPAQDTTFLFNHTWSFDNFGRHESEITWEMFRQNFIGIPPTRGEANPFDKVMFDEVYRKQLYPPGHCFGMDLMAMQLFKYGGYDGFCSPAYQHGGTSTNTHPNSANDFDNSGPIDPRLLFAIQMQHGRQIGHRFLMHVLDLIAVAKQRDGNYAYSQFLYYQSKKEPCVISVTKAITPADGGHALVPYFAEDLGDTRRIYVYDVNRSFHLPDNIANPHLQDRGWYIGRENFIEIDESDGSWRFFMSNDTTADLRGELWQGSPSSGGNLVILPFSVMNVKDRLPQSLFADAAEALGKIFIYGDKGTLKSIRTPDGRKMDLLGNTLEEGYAPLNTVYPYVPINGGASLKGQGKLFFIRGEADFDLNIEPAKEGFKMQLFSQTSVITIEAPPLATSATIYLRDFHANDPLVWASEECLEITITRLENALEYLIK